MTTLTEHLAERFAHEAIDWSAVAEEARQWLLDSRTVTDRTLAVLRALAELGPGCSIAEVAEASGLGMSATYSALRAAVRAGLVSRGPRYQHRTWRPTQAGLDALGREA